MSKEADENQRHRRVSATKRGRGRPPVYTNEMADQAKKLVFMGASDSDLAEFFSVNLRTLQRWRTRHPAFAEALHQAKNDHDNARVERAAYHRAIGYTFESEKVFQYQGKIVRADVVEHIPPDAGLLQFWLTNRKPEDWRSKAEITGANGGPIQTIDVSGLTPVERAQRLAAIMALNGGSGPVIDGTSKPVPARAAE